MEGINKNYGLLTEIEEDIKNMDLENFLEFDLNGRYDFTRCEDCNGPLFRHTRVKYSGKEYTGPSLY